MAERESMQYDVVDRRRRPRGPRRGDPPEAARRRTSIEIGVCVLEKGSEVGAHILSGAVMDPRALNELIPDWKEKGAPLNAPVTRRPLPVPHRESARSRCPDFMLPACFKNHGNYVVSLGNVCRWLGQQAEALGVEIFPGFAAAEVLYDENGAVKRRRDRRHGHRQGRRADRRATSPGMELHAQVHALRRRLPRPSRAAAAGALSSCARAPIRRSTASA